MSSTRELRRRIRSVRSIRQTTKAMELVSTTKMRRATSATLNSRGYASRLREVLEDIYLPSDTFSHPLLEVRPIKQMLLVVITSDRGLAGIYNNAIIRKAMQFAKQQRAKGRKISFITIGKKGQEGLFDLNETVEQCYPSFSLHLKIPDLAPITTSIIESYLAKTYDHISLIYTKFFSAFRQEAKISSLLPLQDSLLNQPSIPNSLEKLPPKTSEFLYEPNQADVLNQILPRITEMFLYQALLESLASEHSARRMAMENATDNASGMIEHLNLTYNTLRQSAITQEIAEISRGSIALSN